MRISKDDSCSSKASVWLVVATAFLFLSACGDKSSSPNAASDLPTPPSDSRPGGDTEDSNHPGSRKPDFDANPLAYPDVTDAGLSASRIDEIKRTKKTIAVLKEIFPDKSYTGKTESGKTCEFKLDQTTASDKHLRMSVILIENNPLVGVRTNEVHFRVSTREEESVMYANTFVNSKTIVITTPIIELQEPNTIYLFFNEDQTIRKVWIYQPQQDGRSLPMAECILQ